MKVGIVGLPNVGKSTLFNAFLKRQQALSANYPFATIEPNIGVVDVFDPRVDELAKISHPQKKIYANITFIDIAGIVEGAHRGEGLGNQFLANIREVDLILILLRDFSDENVVREGSRDPKSDYEVIMTELILKDLETIDKQDKKIKSVATSKGEQDFKNAVWKLRKELEAGNPASMADLTHDEKKQAEQLHLLTLKPHIKLLNVDEKDLVKRVNEYNSTGEKTLAVSAKIESELASLGEEDRKEFLAELGLKEMPLNKVIKVCYDTLQLKTFFTTGPKETRAWKFKDGMTANECAGIIHTDFTKNFIKAEVIKYEDFVACGGKSGAKDLGKLRLEGKNYNMQDGDVVEFRIGA